MNTESRRNDLLATFAGVATSYIANAEPTRLPDNDARLIGMVRRAVRRRLRGLTEAAIAEIRPVVELVLDESAPATGTRWGGLPALPSNMEWPRQEGSPMTLTVTVDCAQMARLLGDDWPFPAVGELLLFHLDYMAAIEYSWEACSVGRIIHVPGTDPRREPPEELSEYGVYPEVAYRATRRLMFSGDYDMRAAQRALNRRGRELVCTGVASDHYLLGHGYGVWEGKRPLLHVGPGPGTEWGKQSAISMWMDVDAFDEGRLGDVHVGCGVD
ncbi:DUF1963 domain-containing protein [Stackebrandtia soli]|uniref:DUF1963 domain-containing protein n=1 Tax=Stackebrandtia soli TaxID=1892856 RepID=UPI0039E8B8CB